jgi:hypothetical protein
MEESLSCSSSEEVETIPQLLQTLRNSNNKDEIVEAIEELRTISRGDGNFQKFESFLAYSFSFHLLCFSWEDLFFTR